MKTAVSLQDDIFRKAERLAKRMKKSRSRLVSDALREYVARHAPDEVTDAMNAAMSQIGEGTEPFVSEASRRTLRRNEW